MAKLPEVLYSQRELCIIVTHHTVHSHTETVLDGTRVARSGVMHLNKARKATTEQALDELAVVSPAFVDGPQSLTFMVLPGGHGLIMTPCTWPSSRYVSQCQKVEPSGSFRKLCVKNQELRHAHNTHVDSFDFHTAEG